MGNMAFVNSNIEAKLKDLQCGYIGRVVWTDGDTATVQPLGLIKENGSDVTKVQAVVTNVPVACKYKISTKRITYYARENDDDPIEAAVMRTQTIAVPSMISTGDLVACLCADRDITAARRGDNELPPAGYHRISDSIIVGIL